jgi:FHS family L-fucose permease-like MFS transporter
MVGFMVGRFAGTFIMKYVKPAALLSVFAIINIALLAVALMSSANVAVYAVVATPFFMSIMFPTIFALGIAGLGAESKIASSLLVMAIVGGAFFPLVMGWISDATGGNIQLSYVVPLLCFLVVLWFGFTQRKAAVVGAPADPHALQVA